MSRVVLTGGAGFIGRALARALTKSGWSVRALDNLNPHVHSDPERSAETFSGELLVGDVRDPRAVASALRGCDAVVHLAAVTGVSQSMYEAEQYRETNVGGTANVARAAAQARAAMVVFSSRAVYGEGTYACPTCGVTYGARCCESAVPRAAREDDPLIPASVYGETKMEAEAIARQGWPEDVPLLVLRPQNVVGPGYALTNPYTGVLAAFAARLQAGLPLQLFGSGEQTRDFVHVVDVVELASWALENSRAWHDLGVLNVGTGVRSTLNELALATARQHGDAPVCIEHVDVLRAGDIEHACADMTTAAQHAVPIPCRPMEAAVREFIVWAMRQPPAFPGLWDRALDELAEKGLLWRSRG